MTQAKLKELCVWFLYCNSMRTLGLIHSFWVQHPQSEGNKKILEKTYHNVTLTLFNTMYKSKYFRQNFDLVQRKVVDKL